MHLTKSGTTSESATTNVNTTFWDSLARTGG